MIAIILFAGFSDRPNLTDNLLSVQDVTQYKNMTLEDIMIDGKDLVGQYVSVMGDYVKITSNDAEWLAADAGINPFTGQSYISAKKIFLVTENADRAFKGYGNLTHGNGKRRIVQFHIQCRR